MVHTYNTRGTCSRQIIIEAENGIIKYAKFIGGCSGNTQGIAALIKGMKIEDVIARCKNIDCSGRGTSCPDQLARALEELLVSEGQ